MDTGIQIRQLGNDTWIFEEQGVRFFLLTGSHRALLIDSGMMTHNAKDLAEKLTDLPLSLLNTHADPDHIGSNAQFDAFYMSPAEAVNYYHTRQGRGEILPIWDGDELDLGDRKLRMVEMPGHTPGSLAVIDLKYRRAFTGDPIQRHGRIFMFGIHREMHAYRLSLKKLYGHVADFDEIYPSHADAPIAPDIILDLWDAAGRIMEGKIEGHDEEMHGTPITAYDVGFTTFLCDRRSAF